MKAIQNNLVEQVFSIQNEEMFLDIALKVFHYQYKNIPVYQKFCDLLKIDLESVCQLEEIPFLPIEFFKTLEVKDAQESQIIFTSSGTTGSVTSKHFVPDLELYERSFRTAFEQFYGSIKGKCILGLLPSYLEREGSSLVYMVDDLIKKSQSEHSGFYLKDYDAFIEKINFCKTAKIPVVVIGVSYALLDIAEKYEVDFTNVIVMETGGMKGKRKEMTKTALHQVLKKGLRVNTIHSEYGMTELLSQAYSMNNETFKTPAWMKVLIREQNDPFAYTQKRTGGINVIDLANIHSCAFIATQDLGKIVPGGFKIMGRFDNSDIRGCNLMYNL